MYDIIEILNKIKHNVGSAFFYTPYKNDDTKSYIFSTPKKTIICKNLEEIESTLNEIDSLSKIYKYAYGFITYEVGYSFEEKLKQLFKETRDKLISFNFYNCEDVKIIPSKEISFKSIQSLLGRKNFTIKNLELNQTESEYEKSIKEIKRLIEIGDTYQVNYTLKSKFNFDGDITSFVASLIFNQSAEYTAFINDENNYIISSSPELFFKTDGDKIISKPMKGTIKRGINLDDDFAKSEQLKSSKKDKAENIMIVDLLRNDIGKISKFNSVTAKPLFEIEKFETLFQMTSTVSGELKEKSFSSIIKNLFPCGSITGAPKIRTMEIINSLERGKRGIYTGTIGLIDNGDYNFNIPIRTITINKNDSSGEMGIGSGIVWDSISSDEFEEAKLKSNFLTKPANYFELIETMLVESGDIFLIENHINRLRKSAEYFLFHFDESKLRELLYQIVVGLNSKKRFKIRLLLSKWGELKYSLEEILDSKNSGRIVISDKRINSNDYFKYFKTTNRKLFNSEFKKWKSEGFDDVIFQNEKGEITEGAITNIMISKGGKLFTPPVSSGLLNGCYRGYLLTSNKNITEKILFVNDLISADEVFILNSVIKVLDIGEVVLGCDS
ncbi:MAG: aminodeoxychorismate synthase component I [Melioribacteraceae bacterium]|nr:aminodeoxychorismate synthase component I [Melioribacteraceae bacterium]